MPQGRGVELNPKDDGKDLGGHRGKPQNIRNMKAGTGLVWTDKWMAV